MNNITPEQLKVIAENMPDGRPVDIDEDGCVWYVNYPSTTVYSGGRKILAVEYNPPTNDAQCMEIMEKLKIWCRYMNNQWYTIVDCDLSNAEGRGKTINEAVCNAAYEYFKALP